MTKQITISELETLLNNGLWSFDTLIEYSEQNLIVDQIEEFDEDGELNSTDVFGGYGFAVVTATQDGITLKYEESFNYRDNDVDSLTTGTEGQNTVWTIEGVDIVDEDGDSVSATVAMGELWDDTPDDFTSPDYSSVKSDLSTTTDIDIDEDSSMETITITVDNAPDIRFTGEQLASVQSSANNAAGNYSGSTGRWTELALYKTAGGKFICHEIGRTQWQGEQDRFKAAVCENHGQVQEFFGHRWLAKELYAEAGIDAVVDVE